ncbi:MAG: glycosyltransferase [Bacteriovoracia bacterium]
MDSKLVDVLIVNYNSGNYLACCVDSVKHFAQDKAQVWIIDNKSSDFSLEKLKKNEFLQVIRNKSNEGFGKAINRVFSFGKAPYVLILNPDTVLQKQTIDQLLESADLLENKNIKDYILGPRILNQDGTIQFSARSFPSFRTAFFNRNSFLTKWFPNNKFSKQYLDPAHSKVDLTKVDWLSGAALFLPRKTFDKLGGFDPKFFMFCEDTDLCKRANDKKIYSYYDPRSSLVHASGGCSKEVKHFTELTHHKSMWYYYRKHQFSIFSSPFVIVGIFTRLCVRWLHAGVPKEFIRLAIRRYLVVKERHRKDKEIKLSQNVRVVFFRKDHLGDVLVCLPALEKFRKKYPSSKISFVGLTQWKEILLKTKLIDEYIDYPKTSSVFSIIGLLKNKFDVFVELGQQATLLDAIACFLSRIPFRVGYHTSYTGLFYTHTLRWDYRFRSERTIVSRLLGRFFKTEPVNSFFDLRTCMPSEKQFQNADIIIHPFASSSRFLKQWPIRNFVYVANTLASKGFTVGLVGTFSEAVDVRSELTKLDPRVRDFIGKTSLPELAVLVENSSAVICNNSGVYQLSLALRKHTLLINGPSSLVRWGASELEENGLVKILQNKELSCVGQDCSSCLRFDNACMKDIKTEAVLQGIVELLEHRKKHQLQQPSLGLSSG